MKKKITFIIPVCGRNQWRHWGEAKGCPLITKAFASIKRTITPKDFEKYNFDIMIGYDDDDEYFTQEKVIQDIFRIITGNVPNNIVDNAFKFSHHKFSDTKHNPVRCWNHLARIAVESGSDYLYQTGDDVEMLTSGWADKFVSALESTRNIGVAAPKDLGYHGLYTQSFVHKTHLEIMGSYYPDVFTNWYCDDYITGVYKNSYSHYIEDCHIKNTGGPQRYKADDAQPKLIEAVAEGQTKLYKYLCEHDNLNTIDLRQKTMDEMRSVHERYEEISKTMTTAPAKPFWSSAVKIFENYMERENCVVVS